MHRHHLISAALVIGFTLGAWCAGAAADAGKAQELNRALADIGAAEQMLRQRGPRAKRRAGCSDSRPMSSRPKSSRSGGAPNVSAFQQALQVSRIDFNLRLVQRLFGYMERLEERIGYFRTAATPWTSTGGRSATTCSS